ncbi:hypothetical protein ASJ79_12720 [Mycobacterium sp. NAZ190054]|nr:hypothetical protein ASJ79_12720 [Mycobacterium sp. NAZ190054]
MASVVLSVAGCGAPDQSVTNAPVNVLYAGSLAAVMEDAVGPAFTGATGIPVDGEAHGSLGAAQMIRDRLREPDVFVSADPQVNEDVLMGDANGDLVEWYVTFAASELVIGYSDASPLAAALSGGTDEQWYRILAGDGVRLGRGDPSIDPKGYRTLMLFSLAARHYDDPSIEQILGAPDNPEQVLPETSLLARVQTGQFDAGIFYKHEAVAAGLSYVSLPPAINLGDPAFAADYATASYTVPGGDTVAGAPILFTVTIPRDRQSPRAVAWVDFLLREQRMLEELGFRPVPLRFSGDAATAPEEIRSVVTAS